MRAVTLLLAVAVSGCPIERDLAPERFACGQGGPCDAAPAPDDGVGAQDVGDAADIAGPSDAPEPPPDTGPVDAEPLEDAPADVEDAGDAVLPPEVADAPDVVDVPDVEPPPADTPDADALDTKTETVADTPTPPDADDPVDVSPPDVDATVDGGPPDVDPPVDSADDADTGDPADKWAVRIAAGSAHTCVIQGTGDVLCWGWNHKAQLGTGAAGAPTATPSAPASLPAADRVSAGDVHTCAIDTLGLVRCWGDDALGQVTGVPGEPVGLPVAVATSEPAVDIDAGVGHTCVALIGGGVQCWGNNDSGQLGSGTAGVIGPVTVPGVLDAEAVAVGGSHSCALRQKGSVLCWGLNGAGQLGDGTTASSADPVPVVTLTDVEDLAAGTSHTLGRRLGGELARWGLNLYGPDVGSSLLEALPGVAGALEVAVGTSHACVIAGAEPTVLCWGFDDSGDLGIASVEAGQSQTSPTLITAELDTPVAIAAGGAHTCAVLGDGSARCWGSNAKGQLGLADAPGGSTPVLVSGSLP